MPDPVAVRPRPAPAPAARRAPRARRRPGPRRGCPTWSVPAAIRAVRATVVVPGLFAICLKVIGNQQMTLFAVFGGFGGLHPHLVQRDQAGQGGGPPRPRRGRQRRPGHRHAGQHHDLAGRRGHHPGGVRHLLLRGDRAQHGLGRDRARCWPTCCRWRRRPRPAPSATGWRAGGWPWRRRRGRPAGVPKSPGDKLRASAAGVARAIARQLTRSVAGSATRPTGTPCRPPSITCWTTSAARRHAAHRAGPRGPGAGQRGGAAGVVRRAGRPTRWTASMTSRTPRPPTWSCSAPPPGSWRRWPTCSTARARCPDLDALRGGPHASAAHQRHLSGEPDRVRASVAHAAHAQVIAVAARAPCWPTPASPPAAPTRT